MNKKQLLGSQTAKNGFLNENHVIEKFNYWKTDEEIQKWLIIMQYNLDEIESVKAIKLNGFKTDVQIQVIVKLKKAIDCQNLQIKLVSNQRGFNQIDKRRIDRYAEMWRIPENILYILRRYTGEILPKDNVRDKRRMFADEFTETEQKEIINWLEKNKSLIVSDILKGRGQFSAEWMLVAQKLNQNSRWILQPMNICLNYFGNAPVVITKKGNFKIGKIIMQRKGGDNGRESAKMLQFKINPAELFCLQY